MRMAWALSPSAFTLCFHPLLSPSECAASMACWRPDHRPPLTSARQERSVTAGFPLYGPAARQGPGDRAQMCLLLFAHNQSRPGSSPAPSSPRVQFGRSRGLCPSERTKREPEGPSEPSDEDPPTQVANCGCCGGIAALFQFEHQDLRSSFSLHLRFSSAFISRIQWEQHPQVSQDLRYCMDHADTVPRSLAAIKQSYT